MPADPCLFDSRPQSGAPPTLRPYTGKTGEIALIDPRGNERLRYDHTSAPKPFFHPIRLPSGTPLTACAPPDHPWHRGLWMAWKFVGGTNYWEEPAEGFGSQKTRRITARTEPHGAVTLRHTLEWRDGDRLRLQEMRRITIRTNEKDILWIDWESHQRAREDLVLDRTPYTTWGGYGGVFLRMALGMQRGQIVLADGSRTARVTGVRHPWGGIEGTLPSGEDVAVVFFPATSNRRFPEPFYGDSRPDYCFFGPAPLFHEPLSLKRGETLVYRLGLLILPQRIDVAEATRLHALFTTSTGSERKSHGI